jgi:hypothetical protein
MRRAYLTASMIPPCNLFLLHLLYQIRWEEFSQSEILRDAASNVTPCDLLLLHLLYQIRWEEFSQSENSSGRSQQRHTL